MRKSLCFIFAILILLTMSGCKNEKTKTNENNAQQSEKNSESITIYSLKDDTLCPILTDNEANRQMLGIIYESLVQLKSTMEPDSVLATDWSVSADGLKWTFNLRDDVKWHSGENLTAQDVVYTVNQIKQSEGSSYLYNVRQIVEAEANSKSVIFTLSEPSANFPNLMTFPIIKQHEEDIDRASYTPCGTGPYIFSDKNEGNMYYLLRNEKWWGGEAKIEEIRVKLLPDSETVMYSFSAGDIDIANADLGNVGKFTGNSDVRTSSCQLGVYEFIGINHKNLSLSNKEVRKAINLAVKRDKIVNDIFAGNADEAISPIRDNWFIGSGEKADYTADAGSAERLLLKNEWKKSSGVYQKKIENKVQKLEFDLLVNEENSSRLNIAEGIKFDLEAIGMSINVIPLPYDEYQNRIANGDYELFIGSVMIPDDLDFAFLLGDGNMFGYEDATMKRILNETKTVSGRDKIIEQYNKLKNRFTAEMPFVGLCFENFAMLYNTRIDGELNSSSNNIYNGISNLYINE